MNIDEVLANIREPMRPAAGAASQQQTGVVLAECPRGHVHRYAISQVARAPLVTCTTCSHGTHFARMVLEACEHAFQTPFVLAKSLSCTRDTNYVGRVWDATHTTPRLLRVVVRAYAGRDGIVDEAMCVHKTTSSRKIAASIREQARVLGIACSVPTTERRVFPRAPLPYTADLARVVFRADHAAVQNATHPTESLCIENC